MFDLVSLQRSPFFTANMDQGTVHSLRCGGGVAGGILGGHAKKKNGFHRGGSQKYKEKGGHVRYFIKTLKWHNVFIFKKSDR